MYGQQESAKSYIDQWSNLAVTSDWLVLSAGSGSSGVIYNLYADKLLQLNLLNDSVRHLESFA